MDKISKKDILDAIDAIDADVELRRGRASSTYDLIYNNIAYPPKLVISIANKFATGYELQPNDFPGGLDTPAFKLLESFDFEIDAFRKDCLVQGLDEIGLTMQSADAIKEYEKTRQASQPWVFGAIK